MRVDSESEREQTSTFTSPHGLPTTIMPGRTFHADSKTYDLFCENYDTAMKRRGNWRF